MRFRVASAPRTLTLPWPRTTGWAKAPLGRANAFGAGAGQEGEVLQMDVGDAILYGFGEGFRVLAREADVANVQHDACGAVERVQEREEGLDSVEHVALILVYAANAQSFGRVVDLAGARGDDGNGFCRGRVRGAGTEAGQQRMVQKPAAHFGGGARPYGSGARAPCRIRRGTGRPRRTGRAESRPFRPRGRACAGRRYRRRSPPCRRAQRP